ncbi:GyrI-like domain-containing protein [Algimonas porphyrae]|uniref:AraC family transcriptional regulator n=1 Tax=Algimonas porphyrae TaxID=1128113 RepID=UPI0024E05E1B|nr:helix-turn-helix domain-containing protein [Algimonas porphyrae]
MSRTKDRALAAAERAYMLVRKDPRRLITLEAVAKEAGYSASRLHTLFLHRYGETFGAFVRRVRLEKACGLMRAHQNWTLTQIALEAGYSESSDFSRSFRRAFGTAPREWDRVAPLNGLGDNERNRQAEQDPACDNAVMKAAPDLLAPPGSVRIEHRPRQTVAIYAVPQADQAQNLRTGWDRFERWLCDRDQRRPERMMMGLSYDSHYDSPGDVFRFELAHPVDPEIHGHAGVVIRDLPETQAAVLSCQGGLAEFSSAWDYLGRVFLPDSPWEPASGPAMEIYFDDPRPSDMAHWNMDCVLPVQCCEGEAS